MTLNEVKIKEMCKVSQIDSQGQVKRRLIDMGITPGVEIIMNKRAPLGDPIEISLRGYTLSLRKEEARKIIVERIGV